MRRICAVTALAVLALLLTAVGGPTVVAAPAGEIHAPNLQTVIPLDSFSIVQTPTGREFRYTHLVYNAGPGPLEVQPSYDQASGGYRGTQLLFTHNPAGAWSQAGTRRVPDVFVYHAEHGSTPFSGQGWIRPVYFSLLASHVLLAIAVLPLALVTLYRAWRADFAGHRRIAEITFPIWMYVSVTGVLVYWMLYQVYGESAP